MAIFAVAGSKFDINFEKDGKSSLVLLIILTGKKIYFRKNLTF